MGNYENLKQSITEVIKTNGNQEITGAVLQSTLLTIISTVGANATFAGIAIPTTNPGTPDGSVFYLASESGTYPNFGGVELQDGLSVLMWNGSWSSQQIFGVDDVPTAGSDNLVKSGGVYTKIKTLEDAGYVFAGIATPTTNPGTPDQNVFYIASEAGTYTNFGGITLTEEVAILSNTNGSWAKLDTGIVPTVRVTELEQEIVYKQSILAILSSTPSAKNIVFNHNFKAGDIYTIHIEDSNGALLINSPFDVNTSYANSISYVQANHDIIFSLDNDATSISVYLKASKQSGEGGEVNVTLSSYILGGKDVRQSILSNNIVLTKDQYDLHIPNKYIDYSDGSVGNSANWDLYVFNAVGLKRIVGCLRSSTSSAASIAFYRDTEIKPDNLINAIQSNPTNPVYDIEVPIDAVIAVVGNAHSMGAANFIIESSTDRFVDKGTEKEHYDNVSKKISDITSILSDFSIADNYFDDFALIDKKGNVLMKLANGHIRTKNFDSNAIQVAGYTSSDFCLIDKYGYSLVKLINGHIRTKNFDSSNVADAVRKIATPTICDLNEKNKIKAYSLSYTEVNNTQRTTDFKFAFFSDLHNYTRKFERLVELVDNWGNNYFDCIINGGDIVSSFMTDGLSDYYNILAKTSTHVLNIVGNHDTWLPDPETWSKQTTDKVSVYNLVVKPIADRFAGDSTFVQPTNAAVNGLNYYYKDYNNVRIVVIDCMFFDTAQRTWFADTLENARVNSKSVIAVTHAPFVDMIMEKIPSKWNAEFPYRDGTKTPTEAAQCVKDFIDNGGDFIIWLSGHSHSDEIHKLPNYSNQIIYSIASPRGTTDFASDILKSENEYDYNYDLFNFCTVDIENKLFKMVRIGADYDTYGKQHDIIVINYKTNKIYN